MFVPRVCGCEQTIGNDKRAYRKLKIADETPTNEMVRRLIPQP
jgi:hypothetical protein